MRGARRPSQDETVAPGYVAAPINEKGLAREPREAFFKTGSRRLEAAGRNRNYRDIM